MYLQLDEEDRIVVEYNGPKTESTPTGNRVVVACNQYEVLDTDIYMVLWQLRSEPGTNKWQVIWRGNWDTTMKQFAELVGDIDHDAMIENRAEEEQRIGM